MVARLIHEASPRAQAPFFVINCAAIPEQLIESELFGHMRGAFTGAIAPRVGVFEAAADGTIFLDEIAELPLTSQAKLLRVLEERCFQRVGSTRSQDMKARVIAATNRDLSRMVEDGQLRADLFYRLSVVQLKVPALRERGDDIVLLAKQILRAMARRHCRRIDGFSAEALDAVRGYPWPGNVRELRNVIESAVVLGEGPLLNLEYLPTLAPIVGASPIVDGEDPDTVRLPVDLASLETKAIEAALRATNGNRTRAASLLGINRVTLYKKLRQPCDADAAEVGIVDDEPVASTGRLLR
jgi:DNA-binding NtrC family response regulator